jgi:hypothetical protein
LISLVIVYPNMGWIKVCYADSLSKGDLIGFDYDNKKILIAKVQDKIFDVHFGYRYLEYLSTIDNNSNIIIASLTTEKKKK